MTCFMSAVIQVEVASSVSNVGGSEETVSSYGSDSSYSEWEHHRSRSGSSEEDESLWSTSGTEESFELSSEENANRREEGVSKNERGNGVDEGECHELTAAPFELGLTSQHNRVVRRGEGGLRATTIVDDASWVGIGSDNSVEGDYRGIGVTAELKREEGEIGEGGGNVAGCQGSQRVSFDRGGTWETGGVSNGMIARLCESVSDTSRVNFLMSVVEAYVQSLHIVQLAGEETRAQLAKENGEFRKEIAEIKAALERERKAVQDREERVVALEREVEVSRDLGSWQVSLCEFEARLLAREQEIDRTARERLRQCLEHIATRENQAWEAISQSSTRTSSL